MPNAAPPSRPKPEVPSLEQLLSTNLSRARALSEERFEKGKESIRREPVKAVLYAAGAGYLLRILPVGALFKTFVGVGLALVRPAAVLYLAAKACLYLERAQGPRRGG